LKEEHNERKKWMEEKEGELGEGNWSEGRTDRKEEGGIGERSV
jgi:hypothetical protein